MQWVDGTSWKIVAALAEEDQATRPPMKKGWKADVAFKHATAVSRGGGGQILGAVSSTSVLGLR